MRFLLFRAMPGLVLLSFMLLSPPSPARGETLIESFDVRGHEIAVRLWQDAQSYKTVKALPLSIQRNLHSFWGSLLVASDGRIYLPPATHSDLGASIWLVRYDPHTFKMDMVFEARKQLGKSIGFDGLWDSKIHTGALEGRNGKVYFAGMIGGSYATMYTHMVHPSGYMGGHVYQHDLQSGETVDLGIPDHYVSLIAADLDVERNILYLINWPQTEFLIYPLDTKVVRDLGTVSYHPEGPNRMRLNWGRDLFVFTDHTVWTNNNFGCFVYYDPEKDDLIDTKIALPRNEALRVHVLGCGPTAGKVYCITNGGWMFEFDPAKRELINLGPVIEAGAVYSPNLAITPDGGSLYYIAGTHGFEAGGGMHVMRYDILERRRIDCGRIGRETIQAFYCYGAGVYEGLVYFNIHGGEPSNSYLLIYDPADNKVSKK